MKKEFEEFVKNEGYVRINNEIYLVTSEIAQQMQLYGADK